MVINMFKKFFIVCPPGVAVVVRARFWGKFSNGANYVAVFVKSVMRIEVSLGGKVSRTADALVINAVFFVTVYVVV